jgi:hypothetical protein
MIRPERMPQTQHDVSETQGGVDPRDWKRRVPVAESTLKYSNSRLVNEYENMAMNRHTVKGGGYFQQERSEPEVYEQAEKHREREIAWLEERERQREERRKTKQ